MRYKIVVFLLLEFVFISLAYAGAWAQPKGKGLMIPLVRYYRSCQYWDPSGNLHDVPCYYQSEFNPYLEYGLTDKLTIGMNPFVRQITNAGIVGAIHFDNSEFFGRYLFWQKDYSAFSAQFTVNIPFYQKFPPVLAFTAPFAVIQRQYYVNGRLLYGTGGVFNSKNKSTWYANFEGAFQHYFNGAADEIRLDFTTGLKSSNNRVELMFQSLNTISLHNPSGIEQPNYNLFKLVPSIVYWATGHVAFQAGVSQDIYGTNTGRGTAPFIAAWIKF
ncbi:MAG: hypothetical protein AB7F64_05565 [Gammaproteobacteria bacterium]